MGLVVTYFSPATPGVASWDVDISDAVRLGTVAGLIDNAELGTVGISSLLFDDPDGTLGHPPEGIIGLKQIHIDETACPVGNQRLFTGYIADRHYRRGTDSLITGVARKIDATIVDVNSFLSFRILAPVALDPTSSFVRPAETDIERVQGLLADVDFLTTTLFDLGFVASSGGVAMDACDYTGQHPADVLNDCSQASGRNHFAYYDEAAGHYGLFYDFDYAAIYDSALQISNVLADVDGITTFAPEPDAELVRDPSRIASAIYLPFNGSNSPAYRTRPANACNYAWRDHSAPSSNVKTLAKANARADRYLMDSVPEDDRITCTVKLPASKVTGIKAGQRVKAKFSHLPNGTNAVWGPDFQWCRVLNRDVMANEQTNVLYNVRYELSPIVTRSIETVYITVQGDGEHVLHTGNMYDGGSMIAPSSPLGTVIHITSGNWYRIYYYLLEYPFTPTAPFVTTLVLTRNWAGHFNAPHPWWTVQYTGSALFGIDPYVSPPLFTGYHSFWAEPNPGSDDQPVGTVVEEYFGLQANVDTGTCSAQIWVEDLGPGDISGPFATPPPPLAIPLGPVFS